MDYREREERDRLLHAQFVQLMTRVATLMPDWKMGTAGDETVESRYWRPVFEKGGMKFGITREQGGKQDKVTVSTWSWPEYTTMEQGRESKRYIAPRDLSRELTSPSISCSIARGADAIVKDIKRRFIPEYENLYVICQAKANEHQSFNDRSREMWEEVCDTLGKNPNHERHYFGPLTIERRSMDVKVELNMSPTQLHKLIEAMGYTNNTK